MDSSRLLDSARDPYARRQAPSMAFPTNLSSGQSYYTVESLEGASSLPLLKPGFASSAPLSERDAFLRLNTETRALLADRETLDARARLLAAEREALLRRSVPGPSVADGRAYADGLPPVDARTRPGGLPPLDARTRIDGLPPVDARSRLDGLAPVDARSRLDGLPLMDARTKLAGLPPVDVRTRLSFDELHARAKVYPHELGVHPHDALRLGLDDRGRAPAAEYEAAERRSMLEILRTKERAAELLRSASAMSRSPVDSLQPQRGITDVRTPAMQLNSSYGRREENPSRFSASSFRQQRERPLSKGSREPVAPRPVPAEFARKQNKVVSNVKSPVVNSKTKPPPEQSEGWCALCKIDCHTIKSLDMHVNGKRHKAMVEGNPAKAKEDSGAGKFLPVGTTQVERKRASEAKPETSQKAKRAKTTSASAFGNGTPTVDAAAAKKGKVDDSKKESDKKLGCEICNIYTTGLKNFESHLKGKQHAARLKQLGNS